LAVFESPIRDEHRRALIQVILVPVCLTIGGTAIAFTIQAMRTAQ
jgi:hypothetical protein